MQRDTRLTVVVGAMAIGALGLVSVASATTLGRINPATLHVISFSADMCESPPVSGAVTVRWTPEIPCASDGIAVETPIPAAEPSTEIDEPRQVAAAPDHHGAAPASGDDEDITETANADTPVDADRDSAAAHPDSGPGHEHTPSTGPGADAVASSSAEKTTDAPSDSEPNHDAPGPSTADGVGASTSDDGAHP